jgi:hypothetical protein
MIRHALALSMLLGVPLQAFAQEGGETATGETTVERTSHRFDLSTSVLRPIAVPMGEVGAELNQNDKIGYAVTFGIGPGKVTSRDEMGDFSTDNVLCLSGGAHFRYYLLGEFDKGMFVGAELAYIWLDRDDRENTVLPPHEGLWGGPTVGYKHTFSFGMMLSAAVTFGAPLYRPDGIDEDDVPGDIDVGNHPKIGPILVGPNASIGWAL